MKLADYMHSHGITPRQLRWMLGVKSRTTVQRYIRGDQTPTAAIMERIRQLTDGEVTIVDFLDPSPPRCVKLVTDRRGHKQWVFPWTQVEQHRWPKANNDNRTFEAPSQGGGRPPRPPRLEAGSVPDHWPSPPLQRAMTALGDRVRLAKRGGFLLDGRLVDARRVVIEANRVLRARGEHVIAYPGVEPLL